jgi:RNA-directed DNA polymerase
MGTEVRGWRLHRWVTGTAKDLADHINPVVRGWMQYYGAFNKQALRPLLKRINTYLIRWLRGKYRKLRRSWSATLRAWWHGVEKAPRHFAHWVWVVEPSRIW